MSDESLQEELLRLGDEARQIREERGQSKTHWPEDFRRKILDILDKGARPKAIFEATGLKQWTWKEWKRKSGFSELRVVPQRKTAEGGVRLRTRGGAEMTLAFSEVKALFKEGLL